jgi:LysM repeat protein
MEDKTQLSNSESSEKNEKTVVMSSGQKTENTVPKAKEKNPEGEKNKEKPQVEASPSNSKSSEEFLRDSKSKKSVAPIVAAGVAAAAATGAAGVALGATYSENIKEVLANPFESDETPPSAEEVPLAEASTTVEENPVQVEPVNAEVEANMDGMSSLEISGTDQEGNVYSVSFLDIDGDGESDIQTAEFQTVDGVTVSYTEFGNSLDSLFTNDLMLADNTDYVDCGYCGVQEVSMMDSYLYEIQPGDTLSEIAAANNTSVEQLMDLNPQISDPDLIYAGNNLIVPDGDAFEYPQNFESTTFIAEETDAFQSGEFAVEEPMEIFGEGLDDSMFVEEDYFISEEQTETPTGEFVAIDWESFYDNPVSNPYTEELDGMDFEAMETPQSYSEVDYGMEDFGMDESAIGFI